MKNLTRSKQIPVTREKIVSDDPEIFYNYLKNVFQRINQMFTDIVDNLQWSPQYLEQDAVPNPDPRELIIWKDTDASAGDPQYYIVTKTPKGNVVRFPSEETA